MKASWGAFLDQKILASRKKLPVFAQMEEFYKMVGILCFYCLFARTFVIEALGPLV